MATDYGEKERAFIDGLKENTGRDLGEWMQAITAAGLPHRNDIIDWLRHKGFMFSKASWLERIHHNGGKPIYADVPKEAAPRRPAAPARGVPAAASPAAASLAPPPPPPPPAAPISAPTLAGDLDALLAKAKAYRPARPARSGKDQVGAPRRRLHGARKLDRHRRSGRVRARSASRARSCACTWRLVIIPLTTSSKKDRRAAALAKSETLSHMLVLTDARQVDRRLLDLVALAKANG